MLMYANFNNEHDNYSKYGKLNTSCKWWPELSSHETWLKKSEVILDIIKQLLQAAVFG